MGRLCINLPDNLSSVGASNFTTMRPVKISLLKSGSPVSALLERQENSANPPLELSSATLTTRFVSVPEEPSS